LDSQQQIENLIAHGRYLEARYQAERIDEAANSKMQQLLGLALSKSGMPEQAVEHLEKLYKSNPEDPETAGILASAYKELFKKNQQTSFALQSRDTYLKNFSSTGNYYTGINAASMSAMVMQASKSKEIAREIITLIDGETNDFWEAATLGEAYLLTKDNQKAIEYYLRARKLAGMDWGKIGSVYNQLWLLNHYVPVNREALRIFNPPGVVAFAGHMIDHPSRTEPRFPESLESKIKESISNHLRTLGAYIGFCSIACGSDILFAEAMVESGGEVNIFLPFRKEDFVDISVKFAGARWVDRFHALCENHPVHLLTDQPYNGFDALFNFQSKVIIGSALLRSNMGQNKCSLMTVFSKTDLKYREGGTRDTITIWPFPENHINISPDDFRSAHPAEPAQRMTAAPVAADHGRRILFQVLIDLSAVSPLNKDKAKKEVERFLSDLNTVTFKKDIDAARTLLGFPSELNAFQLVDRFAAFNSTLPALQQAGIIVHYGISADETSMENDEINHIGKIVTSGICATEPVAALFALQPEKYSLHLSGSIHAGRLGKNFLVYQVLRKKPNAK
jgi:tetratricopeptide (TPR) repeat protein